MKGSIMRRPRFALPLAVGLLLPLLLTGSPAHLAALDTRFADALFESTWTRSDAPVLRGETSRSWLWGPAPGETRTEPFAGASGGVRIVQYFDKARMESNPAVTDPNNPWSVTTGLLVVEMAGARVQTGPNSFETRRPADLPVAGDANPAPGLDTAPRYSSFAALASLPGAGGRDVSPAVGSEVTATIDRSGRVGVLGAGDVPARVRYAAHSGETGHNIPDVFARFMEQEGPVSVGGKLSTARLFDPVYLLGYPITEAYWTTVPIAGRAERVLVQLYQRRALTYIPSYEPQWKVQMGNVGQHYFRWRYETPSAPAATPAPPTPTAMPPVLTDDTFVRVSGNRLLYRGQPVKLKGTNYWRHNAPFADTWIWWNGHEVYKELGKARELGINTIRIGIPYAPFGQTRASRILWGERCGQVIEGGCAYIGGRIVNNMTQFLQLAASYDMKVLFTLFEWSDLFPSPNDPEYLRQLGYLRGIVAPFANDDRVLGWDLHNEPENYPTWGGSGGRERVIAWAGNMAAALREIDRNHPVTVGVGNHSNLWATGHNGATLLDVVDFASFHLYDAGALRTQINEVEARTRKAVVLEEMGWPTGPATLSSPQATYDEATQLFLYRTMLGDAKGSSLSGVIQWMLWDYPPRYGGDTTLSYEPYFGLVRADGSFKPAAAEFRDAYPAQFLPSRTKTDLPLTRHAGE
jgi:hypothetical protein